MNKGLVYIKPQGIIYKITSEVREDIKSMFEFEYRSGIFDFIKCIKEIGYVPIVILSEENEKFNKELKNKLKEELKIENFVLYEEDVVAWPLAKCIKESCDLTDLSTYSSFLISCKYEDVLAGVVVGCTSVFVYDGNNITHMVYSAGLKEIIVCEDLENIYCEMYSRTSFGK